MEKSKVYTPEDALERLMTIVNAYYGEDGEIEEDIQDSFDVLEKAVARTNFVEGDFMKLNEEHLELLVNFMRLTADFHDVKRCMMIAKKVFNCNSLYKHNITDAYESGWINEEEYNILMLEVSKSD